MLDLDKKLCRLSDVKGNEDIKALSFAKYPGTHCPLFGVAMISSFISDLAVLIIGTGECTYYSKGFAYNNQKGQDNFYSLVIGKNDLTFGCGKKVLCALHEIDSEKKYTSIMVVTTCVLEVIGEDIGSLLIENELDYNAKLLIVNTEHFKCGSHIPGMERSLLALREVIKPTKKRNKSINILGHRKHGVENTEVISVLAREGIEILSIIPSNCTIKDIEKAASAALNVVTDFTALPLAKALEKKLRIPYVYFGRHLMIEKIDIEYKEMEDILGINIIGHLKSKRDELTILLKKAKLVFSGKTFIYGNTPMMAFEVVDYLCSLGLLPLFIQVREYYDSEREDMDAILERGFDPYIAQIANIAPMQEVYNLLKPDIYLGHENPMSLFKKGIVQITTDEVTEKIGYEVPITFLQKILSIYEMAVHSPDVPVGMMRMMAMNSMPVLDEADSHKPSQKGMDELLFELAECSKEKTSSQCRFDENGLTQEMSRAVAKGMPLAIAKMVSKGRTKK